MVIKNVMFDNDDTLYRFKGELSDKLVQVFREFISSEIRIPKEMVTPLRDTLFEKYKVDASAYLFAREFGIPYMKFLKSTCLTVNLGDYGVVSDPKLRSALEGSSLKMSILTNNYSEYARKVVVALEVEDRFEYIMGFRELEYRLKPDIRAFIKASKITGYNLDETMFVDDKAEFLAAAKQLGMTTVLVGSQSQVPEPGIDYKIGEIYEISNILRQIECVQ